MQNMHYCNGKSVLLKSVQNKNNLSSNLVSLKATKLYYTASRKWKYLCKTASTKYLKEIIITNPNTYRLNFALHHALKNYLVYVLTVSYSNSLYCQQD